MKKLTLCLIVMCLMLSMAASVSAARTIQNVTLNGASSVNVSAGEAITANIIVHVDRDNDKKWHSTKYKIDSADAVCIDTPNHDEKGTYSESFIITAPMYKGEYNFKVWAYSEHGCNRNAVSKTLTKAIKIISVCGNGDIEGVEQCDDENTDDGDGCSAACISESIYYFDGDNDGYGDASIYIRAVSAPAGYVLDSNDCDDTNAAIYPGAMESCNNADDNCDGNVDEGLIRADDNLFGLCFANTEFCNAGEWVNSGANYLPANETCDGFDNNCNGETDEGVKYAFYTDADEDGFGNAWDVVLECSAAEGYVADNTDCDDDDESINPNAQEVCNGVDDNCDSEVDEGNFSDADADGVKDCIDTDNDNDGVADAEDLIRGNSSDISTNVPGGLVFSVDDARDAANHAGKGNVKLANSAGQALVEFDYDFANNTLDLHSINITVNSNDGFGSMIIKGINLSGQNATKTAYTDRKAGTNMLCIIDDEIDSIVVEGDCSNGIKLLCEGSSVDYSCLLVENGTKYKVSGLKHSAVAEYIYNNPPVAEAVQVTGGSSGTLHVVRPAVVPEMIPAQEEIPASNNEEAPAVAPKQPAEPKTEQAPEQPASRIANARARLGQITGRVVTSVRNSPGIWGGGLGLVVAISLITAIYISTKGVKKRYFRN